MNTRHLTTLLVLMLVCISSSAQAASASLRVFKHKQNATETVDLNYWTPDYFIYTPYKLINESTYFYNSTTSNKTISVYLTPIDPEGDAYSYSNYTDLPYTNYTLATPPGQWRYHNGTELWLGPVAGQTTFDIKTEIDLLTGDGHTNKTQKYILLTATATRLETVPDPYDPYSSIVEQTPISPSEITVNSKTPNIDNEVFLKTSYNQTRDVTPQMDFSTYSNHVFAINIVPVKLVNLTRTFHPKFLETGDGPTLADIQAKFDEGTEGLARDDDDNYGLNDPNITASTNAASLYRSDDVPTYIEFVIHDVNGLASTYSYSNQVVQTTNKAVFPTSLHGSQYYIISNDTDRNAVISHANSDIKQVHSFDYQNGTNYLGFATLNTKNPAQIIIAHDASAIAYLHEWAHAAGVEHRGEAPNYGPESDAVMKSSVGGWKINRYERGLMLGY